MGLDVNTPAGEVTYQHELIALNAMKTAYGLDFARTQRNSPCKVDGLLFRDGILMGIYETKCRYKLPVKTLQNSTYSNRWLVTFDKILAGLELAQKLFVPYYGILYLVDEPDPDLRGHMVEIGDARGSLAVDIQVRRSETRATVNGGLANRINAYILMDTAYQFRVEDV